jgi:hypothetical protein
MISAGFCLGDCRSHPWRRQPIDDPDESVAVKDHLDFEVLDELAERFAAFEADSRVVMIQCRKQVCGAGEDAHV